MGRKGRPWPPPPFPTCDVNGAKAIDALAAQQPSALEKPTDPALGGSRRLHRMQANLAESPAYVPSPQRKHDDSSADRKCRRPWRAGGHRRLQSCGPFTTAAVVRHRGTP